MLREMTNKKPNNIVRVPCSLSKGFFRYWFMFLEPFHNLTNREIEVAAAFVKYRYELSKAVKDNSLLDIDQMVMNEDTKKKIREECGISSAHFQVIMGKLRKNKVIVNGRINPKFIPNIGEDENGIFQLLLLFDCNND